jgi:hypothetical protein
MEATRNAPGRDASAATMIKCFLIGPLVDGGPDGLGTERRRGMQTGAERRPVEKLKPAPAGASAGTTVTRPSRTGRGASTHTDPASRPSAAEGVT